MPSPEIATHSPLAYPGPYELLDISKCGTLVRHTPGDITSAPNRLLTTAPNPRVTALRWNPDRQGVRPSNTYTRKQVDLFLLTANPQDGVSTRPAEVALHMYTHLHSQS